MVLAGPRLGGKTSFLFGDPQPETIDKSTLLSMLLTQFFDEIHRETTLSTFHPVDIAVKLAVIDVVNSSAHDVSGQLVTTETIRDLLNLENSSNIRVSKSQGVAKFSTEQYVSGAREALDLVERAFVNRRFRFNADSFLLLQFTVVRIENMQQRRQANAEDESLESASMNRKSYLRIYEGVNLAHPAVSALALGQLPASPI